MSFSWKAVGRLTCLGYHPAATQQWLQTSEPNSTVNASNIMSPPSNFSFVHTRSAFANMAYFQRYYALGCWQANDFPGAQPNSSYPPWHDWDLPWMTHSVLLQEPPSTVIHCLTQTTSSLRSTKPFQLTFVDNQTDWFQPQQFSNLCISFPFLQFQTTHPSKQFYLTVPLFTGHKEHNWCIFHLLTRKKIFSQLIQVKFSWNFSTQH